MATTTRPPCPDAALELLGDAAIDEPSVYERSDTDHYLAKDQESRSMESQTVG